MEERSRRHHLSVFGIHRTKGRRTCGKVESRQLEGAVEPRARSGRGKHMRKDGRLASVVAAVMKGASLFRIKLAHLAPLKPSCRTQGASHRTGRAMPLNVFGESKECHNSGLKSSLRCSRQVKWILFYNKFLKLVLHIPSLFTFPVFRSEDFCTYTLYPVYIQYFPP